MADAQWGLRTWDAGEWLSVLDIIGPTRQRRLTVLVRPLLLVPHLIVLVLLYIAAVFTVVVGWFAALVLGVCRNWSSGSSPVTSERRGCAGHVLRRARPGGEARQDHLGQCGTGMRTDAARPSTWATCRKAV